MTKFFSLMAFSCLKSEVAVMGVLNLISIPKAMSYWRINSKSDTYIAGHSSSEQFLQAR